VGLPIVPPGSPTILIGGQPAARFGDQAMCTPAIPDPIVQGAITVKIGGMMAARMTDKTAHGGSIAAGYPTVMIGGPTSGGVLKPTAADPRLAAFIDPYLWRPGATIGNGGTADSVRYTRATGVLVGGSDHVIKATEAMTYLERFAAANAGTADAEIAYQLWSDLGLALAGF
jgi:uncharacterized Zn-binding protein involved in type VI secretion